MIKIILILLLIHYIGLYLFKIKFTTLNCGLFGYAGNSPKKFNKDKFDKLGILNVERGKSSCGIAIDGDIQIGIDGSKLYYDFIMDREIKPKKFPIVIGHTRQSSVGAVNMYNAHPFGFGDNNNDFIFIGAHNGTLKNHSELAKKYEIEECVENSTFDKFDKEIVTFRNKIDSEILLEIIYKHKNFKVLSEYVGGAALVFTDTTTPNVLYLFKGKSKDWASSTHESIERPLFVYVEGVNSMYFSSLEDSLKTIGGNDKNIIDIQSNTVYKITDGNFKNAELIPVTRINATQNLDYINKHSSIYNANYNNRSREWDYGDDYIDNINYGTALQETKKEEKEEKSTLIINLPLLLEEKKEINIYDELLLKNQDLYLGVPYFNKLRWLRNGQTITGIYIWINHYGYYPLAYTEKKAEERFNDMLDKVFDGKNFYKDNNFNIGKVPFNSCNLIIPCFFYFVEGVQLKTYLDYSFMYQKYINLKKNMYLDYIELSKISTHPIINISYKNQLIHNQNVIKDGLVYSGTITCLGAEKIYTFNKGNLKILEKNSYYANFTKDYYSMNTEKKEIKVFSGAELFDDTEFISEQNDDFLIEEMIEKEEEITQMIKDMCDEDFTESIKDLQRIKSKVFDYSDNCLAVKLISFVDNTLKDIKEFIN